MSGLDPENGDPIENPEPEEDSGELRPQEQEGAESDTLEAESESAAAATFGATQGYADLAINQEHQTAERQALEAESEASNIVSRQGDIITTEFQGLVEAEDETVEAEDETVEAEAESDIGQYDESKRNGSSNENCVEADFIDKHKNIVQAGNQLENHRADEEKELGINASESNGDRDGAGESTQAEDEQDLANGLNSEFSGAEWSLEPEDSINNHINTGEGAEGGDVEGYEISNDEVESLRLEPLIETHRTESSDHQIISVDIFTGAQGNESVHLENVEPQLYIKNLGASSNVSEENDWETNSLPEEEDYYYGPEGDNIASVGGQAGTEPLETEADQEMELSAGGAASAFIQGNWNPRNNEGSDVSCPECVEIQLDNHVNTGIHTAHVDEGIVEEDSYDGCDMNDGEAKGAAIQEELCLEDHPKKDKSESESYEPECDQSLSNQKSESSQGHFEVVTESGIMVQSSVNEINPNLNDCINVQGEILETGSNHDNNVIVIKDANQSVDVDCDSAKTENETTQSGTSCDKSNEPQLTGFNQRTINSEENICENNTRISDAVESVEHTSRNKSKSETVLEGNTENIKCDIDETDQGNDRKTSKFNDTGAIPKSKTVQSARRKETDPDQNHQNYDSAKVSLELKNESSGVDSEEELLSELDATLKDDSVKTSLRCAISNKDESDRNIRCEQCARNNLQCTLPNGYWCGNGTNIPDVKNVKKQLHQAKQLLLERECEISRLKEDVNEKTERYEMAVLERDTYQKEVDCLKHQNTDDLYLPQIKELEYTIAQQQTEIRGLKDKLSSHDSAAKKAIAALQTEMKARVDQIQKTCEEATKEKDAMVVKYAQAEHKNLEYLKHAERLDVRLKEVEKEKEGFVGKFKAVKEHRTKVAAELEAKIAELSNVHKDLDKHREQLSSADTRVKWAQNKLKAELEAHKETKVQLEKANIKIKEAKEETQQIRRDCQAIIKTYQESEEVKSNSLDKELKLKESELLAHQQEQNNIELVHVKTLRELEQLRTELKDCKTENTGLKDRITKLETDLDQSQFTVNKYSEIIQRQKKEIAELRERIENLVHVKSDFTRAQELIKTLDSEISDLKVNNKDLVAEMEACRRRETDKLELTAKLSRKNAELQSENTNLSNKVLSLTGELQSFKMECQDVDTKFKDISDSLEKEKKLREEETQSLNTKLAGKCKAVEDLTRKVEEEKDEIKTLKRKHANNMKDLTRQLQQVRRKLENYEVTSNGDKDTTSLGSRTSSNGSLNTVGLPEQNNGPLTTPSVTVHTQPSQQVRQPSPEQDYPVITEQVEVNKQLLIERIVKLQKLLARKNEKIEFMEDHITQLIDEIQKKNRIIQTYVMREETGTMTSDSMDHMKAELSRKHSIMGSLYGSHSTDGTMTLDLSLEINRKLQAVLEDTLLKNMTLKDSLDTLGQEIARLSQENRSLQLKLQGKHHTRTRPR